MNVKTVALLLITHIAVGVVGFGLGIYALPILTAPPAPTEQEVETAATKAQFRGQFKKTLQDSDALHWGEGEVTIGSDSVTLQGRLSPGPDYKLYLSPTYLETEAEFNRLKNTMVRVGDIKTFNNFVIPVPSDLDPSQYNTIIVWCETFGEFITSAQYQ